MTDFKIKKFKSLDGQENLAFECDLCVGKKTIARVSNTGTSGDNTYEWKSSKLREQFEKEVTDDLIWELIEKESPDSLYVEVPASVIEAYAFTEKQLTDATTALATLLGEEWTIGTGIGGTTAIKHPDGFSFNCYISSGATPQQYTHTLCIGMRGPIEVETTSEESAMWDIPDFDIRVTTMEEVASILSTKLEWLRSMIPTFRERQSAAAASKRRVHEAATELAEKLGLPIKGDDSSYGISIEKDDKRVDSDEKSLSIGIHPQTNGDKGSFYLSAERFSDEQLIKLIEFCKDLEI